MPEGESSPYEYQEIEDNGQEHGQEGYRPRFLRDKLASIDLLRLGSFVTLGATLSGVAISLWAGTSYASAMGMEGLSENEANQPLFTALMNRVGDVIANLGGIMNQDPDEGFIEEAFKAVVVDGTKALLDIYRDSGTFPKSTSRTIAGLVAGGVHALYGLNRVRMIFEKDYPELFTPKLLLERAIDSPRRDGSKDPLWKRLLLDLNPVFLAAGFLQSSYLMDSVTTGLTISNAKPTPAWFLSLMMLGMKYKLTEYAYRNEMIMSDLVDMKRSCSVNAQKMPIGKTVEFLIRSHPIFWGLAIMEFTTDIALLGSWINGQLDE